MVNYIPSNKEFVSILFDFETDLIDVGKELPTKTDYFENCEGYEKTGDSDANEVHHFRGVMEHRRIHHFPCGRVRWANLCGIQLNASSSHHRIAA